MEWIKIEDKLPVDVDNIKFYGSREILVVSGGAVECCELVYGPLPEPWYKLGNFHKGYVTHWAELPEPPKAT